MQINKPHRTFSAKIIWLKKMSENFKNIRPLAELYPILLKQRIPFVSYRLPHSSEIVTLIQQQSSPQTLNSLDELQDKNGFVIAPFSNKTNHPVVFLQPGITIVGNEIDADILKLLSENTDSLSSEKIKNNYQTTQREDFISMVEKTVAEIKSSEYQKVVLSKVKTAQTPSDFQPGAFFFKLCGKYPTATVYLLQTPETGCWAGATPETLLVVENEAGRTMSLAGTQKASNQAIETYQWSEKEVEEHELVTDFIETQLNKCGIQNYIKSKRENLQAGNLIHLHTKFEFPVVKTQNHIGRLISLLHPTPATGGLPESQAIEFILKNEKHDRSYYTGFLGPVNIQNKTNLFVNLRCVQLFENEYVLFSGAGITAPSAAENEWDETDNKFKTMEDVILS